MRDQFVFLFCSEGGQCLCSIFGSKKQFRKCKPWMSTIKNGGGFKPLATKKNCSIKILPCSGHSRSPGLLLCSARTTHPGNCRKLLQAENSLANRLHEFDRFQNELRCHRPCQLRTGHCWVLIFRRISRSYDERAVWPQPLHHRTDFKSSIRRRHGDGHCDSETGQKPRHSQT
jgi:hypothetical protein